MQIVFLSISKSPPSTGSQIRSVGETELIVPAPDSAVQKLVQALGRRMSTAIDPVVKPGELRFNMNTKMPHVLEQLGSLGWTIPMHLPEAVSKLRFLVRQDGSWPLEIAQTYVRPLGAFLATPDLPDKLSSIDLRAHADDEAGRRVVYYTRAPKEQVDDLLRQHYRNLGPTSWDSDIAKVTGIKGKMSYEFKPVTSRAPNLPMSVSSKRQIIRQHRKKRCLS